jgi:hypothetical protein
MTYLTGDSLREADLARVKRLREAAAAAERTKQDRIERWGKALSVLPEDELLGIAQRWSSLTEAIVPAAQRALDIQQER